MAKLIWAVTCARVLTDAHTNLVSYLDVLDSVAAPEFLTQAPQTVVASVWEPEGESTIEVRAKAYGPDGSLLLTGAPAIIKKASSFKRIRLANGLAGYSVSKPGTYAFALEIQTKKVWEEVVRIPFLINPFTPIPKRAPRAKKS